MDLSKRKYSDLVLDLLLFRKGTEVNSEGKPIPILTTGSIAWGVILRSSIIIFFSFIIMSIFNKPSFWWVFLFLLWIFAAYPGWRQFQIYKNQIKEIEESTLCGNCIHFDSTSQLCRLYDEHIVEGYVPCWGVDWEPINEYDKINSE